MEDQYLKLDMRHRTYAFWTVLERLKPYRFPVRIVIDNSAWWANLKNWGEVDAKKTLLLPGQLN